LFRQNDFELMYSLPSIIFPDFGQKKSNFTSYTNRMV
jgi:hypothetical protein